MKRVAATVQDGGLKPHLCLQSPDVSKALAYARARRTLFLRELMELSRFPSVSATNNSGVKRCAEWPATHLLGIGLERVRIIPTKRHPIVYAAKHKSR